MPSVSKSQQRLMGAAYAFATGQTKNVPKSVKDVAKSFLKGSKSEKEKKKAIKKLRDFAKTKHKGLPQSVKESSIHILRFSEI